MDALQRAKPIKARHMMVERDDVTGTVDMAYVITRNAKLAERARRNGGR